MALAAPTQALPEAAARPGLLADARPIHAPWTPYAGLPLDPVLPQLPVALDATRMGEVFGGALAAAVVTACSVDRIKYRPRRSCSVSYRLQLRRDDGSAFEQRVSARFCPPGDARRRHGLAMELPHAPSPAGPDLQCHEGLEMLAWWLPNDPQLPGMRTLADADRLRAAWNARLRDAGAAAASAATPLHAEWVQIVPERRACARVTAGTGPQAEVYYVKCHVDGRGAWVHARMQALSAGDEACAGRLRTPRSMAWQPAQGLHWQRALAGCPLAQVDPAVGAGSAAAVGRLIAALHRSPVPVGDDRLDADALIEPIVDAAQVLGHVQAGWQGQAAAIAARLRDTRGCLDDGPQATLHGDLHPANVLVDAHGGPAGEPALGLIDLDSLSIGPAALELGAWVADALYRTALAGVPLAQGQTAVEAFLDAYVRAGGVRPRADALAWSTARQLLVRRACGAVSNLKAGRLAAVPALLAWAQALAHSGDIAAAWALEEEAA